MKKILKEGEAYECPNEGVVVRVSLIGKLEDGIAFFKKGHDDIEPFDFKADDEQVIDGLDRDVMTIKKGEVALVTIAPEYAFGSAGSNQELAVVPPNATVTYEIQLITFIKVLMYRYNMGVIPFKKILALCHRLSVSSFCRLATVLVRLKFVEHLKEAVTYMEQGHIRVGPDTVLDPAFLVTRNMEEFITIKRKVVVYNDKLDDYNAMV